MKNHKFYVLLCGIMLCVLSSVPVVGASKNDLTFRTLEDDHELLEPDLIITEGDPLESINRCVFAFNQGFDYLILKPLATIIYETVPQPGLTGIRNLLDHLFTPIFMINYILQGDVEAFATTLFRFVINTTVGFLGTFDVAHEMGLTKHTTSFNDTLAVWGVDPGPYVVLPLLGPSSFRDIVGKMSDYFMNPLYYISRNRHLAHNHQRQYLWYLRGMYALDGVMLRVENLQALETLEKISFDFYAAMRDVYLERQKKHREN